MTVLSPAPARAAGDPNLKWETFESANFRVTFHSGEREAAQRVIDVAEHALTTLQGELGWTPSEKTEVILTDFTDSANGSATAIPFNTIRLYLTAPDDLSPLSDVDDWLNGLTVHEYTHILHLDNIRGIPALVNRVIGKRWAPNQVQPRWILEGLATMEESKHTSGGRMRSGIWNMYLRSDFLENRVATLDQMSHYVRRFPQGNLWYLYGSFFLRWIFNTYGEHAIRAMIHDYAGQIVPWGINRSIRRATGKTYEELYDAWVQDARTEFQREAEAVREKGLRVGNRVTRIGQSAAYPRWIPPGSWSGMQGGLAYFRDDGHTRAGIYAMPPHPRVDGRMRFEERERELMLRTSGQANFEFAPDSSVVLSMPDVHRNIFVFGDLQRYAAQVTDPSGQNGSRVRLTDGYRAADPAISPDGRRVVFVSNQRGTRYLQIADIDPAGERLRNVRSLVQSQRYEQAYTPRFSPDGKTVAYSVWTQGGYRDLRLVDVATGQYQNLAHDRAVDGGPSFSRDGRYLYFHSDRTGIFNIYALDRQTGQLYQVSNVLGGAFFPEPSPDGRQIAYIGYGSRGYDLYVLDVDPRFFVPAEPYVDTRASAPFIPPSHVVTRKDYNPLITLRPRNFGFGTGPGNYGQAFDVSVAGGDLAGFHSFNANLRVETGNPALQGSFGYNYGRLPFDVGFNLFRSLNPRGGFVVNGRERIAEEETLGGSASATFYRSRAFVSQSVSASYSLARRGAELPDTQRDFNPYDTPSKFYRGTVGVLGINYSFSNAEGRTWSIGPEKGMSLSVSLNLSDPVLASQYRGLTTQANLTAYYPMPWGHHHVLALHGGGGLGVGDYPGKGAFYVGGFVDVPFLDTIQKQIIQGGFVLRGYAPAVVAGSQYVLGNAEYRFPILNLDRGLSTLPIFLNRISGNLFFDYGSAFDDIRFSKFKSGTGAEAWFDLILGYGLSFSMRLGYARGLASEGTDQIYFLASAPY